MSQKFLIVMALILILNQKLGFCIESDVFKLTKENFKESLENHQFLYVKFYTEKCPFSRKVAPVWVLVGNLLKSSKIRVAEIECIQNKAICEQQNVFSYPTIKMFKNGAEVGTFDTEKFNINPENFVEYAKSFTDEDSGKALVPNQRGFGKCLGR